MNVKYIKLKSGLWLNSCNDSHVLENPKLAKKTSYISVKIQHEMKYSQ